MKRVRDESNNGGVSGAAATVAGGSYSSISLGSNKENCSGAANGAIGTFASAACDRGEAAEIEQAVSEVGSLIPSYFTFSNGSKIQYNLLYNSTSS